MTRWQKWLGICVSSTALVLLALIIKTCMTKSLLAKEKTALIATDQARIDHLVSLGIPEKNPQIQILKERIADTQQELHALSSAWDMKSYISSCHHKRIAAVHRQISKNRCMLKSYEKEITYLQSLPCSQESPRLATARENMRQLTVALAHLEHHLTALR